MNETSAGTPKYRPQLMYMYRENLFLFTEIIKKNSQKAKNVSEH